MAEFKQNIKLRFQEIVDRFALRLTEEERERLVHLYELPAIYFTKSRVQVFRAIRTLGIYGHENPEGLLTIAEVLQRQDIVTEFREEIKNLRKLKKLRKHSTVVDLQEIYANAELPSTLEVSMEHIEVLKANVKLLEKITNYRYENDDYRRRRIKLQLENARQKLTDVADCLALAGDEAAPTPRGSPETTAIILKEPVPETQQPYKIDVFAATSRPEQTTYVVERKPDHALYENIGARLGRRGSDPQLATVRPSSAAEAAHDVKQSPKLRRDSVPYQKPTPPPPPPKPTHNLHTSRQQSELVRSTEREAGSESPRTARHAPIVKPKPTRNETRSVPLKPPTSPEKTADYTGSGDSGYGDNSWPKPHIPKEDHHFYQQLGPSSTDESVHEYAEPAGLTHKT